MLQINMNEADGRSLETADRWLGGFRPLADAVPLQTAMDGAAGELGVHASAHNFDDVVERQIKGGAQLADQFLFDGRKANAHALWPMRAVLCAGAGSPAANGSVADAKLGNQVSHRCGAGLDVGAHFRRSGCVGVQVQAHEARRSVMYDTPRLTPIPFSQSRETEHFRHHHP
jgi:hypothetical protein